MDDDAVPDSSVAVATLRLVAKRDRERADQARAQVARERERSHRLAARVETLEAELAGLRASASYRLTYPLRRVVSALPLPIYAILRGRKANVGGHAESVAAPHAPELAVGPAALLVDDWFPEPDRDSGSIDIVNMAQQLLHLGFSVAFGTRCDHETGSEKRRHLESLGVHTLGLRDADDLETYLRRSGRSLSLLILNRVYCGGTLLELARRSAPQARIVFNTVDLNWVRIEREAALSGDEVLRDASQRMRTRALHLAREADAVIVVSSVERDLLRREVPDAYVVELPLARPLTPPVATFADRRGVGFIGGFKHAPNVDAVAWFARDVWPLVFRELPDCRLSIVGPDLPEEHLRGVPGRIEILGHVPDIGPWLESLRLTVAPLRFGAGAKGKIVSSLAAGLPCVGTDIALEGMRLHEGDGTIAAKTPEAMARSIVALHEDATLWKQCSAAALATAQREFSLALWRERLTDLLTILDLLPTDEVAPDKSHITGLTRS